MSSVDAHDAGAPAGPDVEQVMWQLAVDAAGIGTFDWDLRTGELRWDDRLLTVFGMTREQFGGTIEAFNATLHPDDLARVSAALEQAIATCGEYVAEYRIVPPGGEQRWVAARGRAIAGEDGRAGRLIGAAYDTTATVEAEAVVARTLESMPTAFFHLGRDWRFTMANSEALRLLQTPRHELLGAVVWEAFPSAVDSDFERHYRKAMESGEPVGFDAYYPEPLDAWYEVRAWPSPDGLGVYFNDVTARHRAQQQMRVIAERDELLARVTTELTGTLDPSEALHRLARLLVPRLGSAAAAALVDTAALDGRFAVLRQVGGWHVQDETDVRGRSGAGSVQFLPRELMASLDRDRVVTDVTDPTLRAALVADALPDVTGPVVALPLRGRERLVGVVVVAARPDTEFSEEELDTLTAIASRAGLAIDNARLFAEQRDLAEGLQRSLLSRAPHPEGLEVAVCYEAAAHTAQVGGDWYDAFVLESGDTVVVVGDVVGHDTESAAAMGQMRSLLRGIAVHSEEGPADLLRGVDKVLHRLGSQTTATALVARISAEDDETGARTVRWSSAGHPPPAVRGADGDCRLLESGADDLLLGLDPTAERTESTAVLAHGALLVLYTDGLVERRGEDLDVGLERLCATAGSLALDERVPLSTWSDGLVAAMVPADKRDDDVALVAVRVGEELPPAEVEPDRAPAHEHATAVMLPADPTSVGRARRVVREAIAEQGTVVVDRSGEVQPVDDEAMLATSELVTNALVHAGTSVLLRVTAGPRGVRVEVQDGSAHSPVPRAHSVTSATGRGLRLVDSVVDRWDVSRHPDGKTVWFQIGVPPGLEVAPDEPATGPVPGRCVVLQRVPLLMHWAWQEHAAALLREYLLMVLAEDPAALETHAAASDALDLLREGVPAPPSAEGGPDAVLSIAEDGPEAAAEVVLEVPERSVASFAALDRTLAAAVAAARDGRLLGPPTQPEIEQLREWLCGEVARQAVDGAEPQAWPGTVAPSGVRRVVEETVGAHLLEGAGAALLSDEESVLVGVTPQALALLGYADERELLGRPVLTVVPPRFHQAHVAGTTLHATNGRDVLMDVPLQVPVVHADGEERVLGLRVTAHRTGSQAYFLARLSPAVAPPG